MKKVVIFFLCLYVLTCCLYGPSNTQVGSGFTDKLLNNLESFSDASGDSFAHLDLLYDMMNELEVLKERYQAIPDLFAYSDAPILVSIGYTLETLAMTILDFIAVPYYLTGALIVWIVDAIKLIFNAYKLIDIFQHSI